LPDEFKSDACGTDEHLFITLCCTHCGHKIDVPVYCGNRFCPVCGVARRMRVRNRLEFLAANVAEPKDMSMKFLTLTIPSQPDVFVMTRFILKAFRKLRQRAFWKKNVDGGAFVLEIKGAQGYWHVHLHAVLMCNFLPYDELLKLWIGCSKGRGVWIEKIPTDQIVKYLSKYLTKPSVDDVALNDANWALHGLRLFSPFGSWYNLNLTYSKPKAECPECHSTSWMPFDLVYSNHIEQFWKDVETKPKVSPSSQLVLVPDSAV